MGGLKYFKQLTNVGFFSFKKNDSPALGKLCEYDTTELHSDPVPKRNNKKNDEKKEMKSSRDTDACMNGITMFPHQHLSR